MKAAQVCKLWEAHKKIKAGNGEFPVHPDLFLKSIFMRNISPG